MSKGAKLLKLFIFAGVFLYVMKTVSGPGIAEILQSIPASLMLACLAYIAATLFGVILNITRNYLIAIVGFLLLLYLGITKLDSLSRSVSWLTDGFWTVVIIALGIVLIVRDIILLKRPEDISS